MGKKNLLPLIIILSVLISVVIIVVCIISVVKAWQLSINNQIHCREKGGICKVEYLEYQKIDLPLNKLSEKNVTFSKDLAIFFAKCIINWNCNVYFKSTNNPSHMPFGFEKITDIWLEKLKSSPIFGAIFESEQFIIVILRGTSTNKEWTYNHKFSQKIPKYPFGNEKILIHSGFLFFYEMLFPTLSNLLSELYTLNKRIFFIGNSLGGALAVLFSVYYQSTFDNADCYCFNFGKPRIGNLEWQNFANSIMKDKIFRIANDDDLVTNIPLSVSMNLKNPKNPWIYGHEGNYIRISENKKSLALNHSIYTALENLENNKYVEVDIFQIHE